MALVVQPLLDSVGRGDLAEFAEAFASVKVGQLSVLAKESGFHQALFQLAEIAASDPDPLRRLTALSLVGKADTATQHREMETAEACRRALRSPPPRLAIGGDQPLDAEGREYIAGMLAHGEGDWLAPYAAKAFLDETRSDNARAPLASLVLNRSPSLAGAFDLLAEHVPNSLFERPGTKEAELTRTKRLHRLCTVLENTVRNANVESGSELTSSLNRLLQALAFRYSRPTGGVEAREATELAAGSIMSLVSTLVRTRFSISAEPESYDSIRKLKSWFGQGGWPASLKAARAKLSQSVTEAITLRAKMKLPSRDLFSALTLLAGDRRIAEKQLLPIADVPGLDPEIQDWLRRGAKGGGARATGQNLEEAGLRDVDDLIALAAVRANRLRMMSDGAAKSALAEIRELPGTTNAAQAITQLVGLARALPQDLDLIMQRRSLALFGTPGEEVESDPTKQESIDGTIIDSKLVRIVAPGVQRRLPNGTVVVLRKAVVQPH